MHTHEHIPLHAHTLTASGASSGLNNTVLTGVVAEGMGMTVVGVVCSAFVEIGANTREVYQWGSLEAVGGTYHLYGPGPTSRGSIAPPAPHSASGGGVGRECGAGLTRGALVCQGHRTESSKL